MMTKCVTINDAWSHFEELHGGDAPTRTREELRDYIQARGLRYEQLDAAFWDGLFESGWHLADAAADDDRPAFGTWMNEIAALAAERFGRRYRGEYTEGTWKDWWDRRLTPAEVVDEVGRRMGLK